MRMGLSSHIDILLTKHFVYLADTLYELPNIYVCSDLVWQYLKIFCVNDQKKTFHVSIKGT
jgi:hypothetical protein